MANKSTPRGSLMIRIDREDKQRLFALAKEHDRPATFELRRALRRHFDAEERLEEVSAPDRPAA